MNVTVFIILTGDVDFDSIDRELEFMGMPSSNEECFSISVLADDLVEPLESFSIELSSNDSALFITQGTAQVLIVDTTGEP